MSISVFKRYELKYVLTKRQYFNIIDEIKKNLIPDKYGKSTIQSLYYDRDDNLLIRRSIEKPEYKEKIRLRSYGLVTNNDKVYLELKKKCQGVVFKRRIEIKLADACVHNLDDSQISREIKYFMDYYKSLKPKMLLLYDRTAYFGEDELRITFDENIRYRTNRLALNEGLDGNSLNQRDIILMEIKMIKAMPMWLSKLLDKEKIYKTSFSKYGEAYKKELLNRTYEEEQKIG